MLEIKYMIFILIGLTLGLIISDIDSIYAINDNCKDLPSFHIIHINKIIDCLENRDNTNQNYIDVSNIVLNDKINRLEERIEVIETITRNETLK